jgi:hypothetical protein
MALSLNDDQRKFNCCRADGIFSRHSGSELLDQGGSVLRCQNDVIGENVWDSRGHDENDMSISLLVTFGPFRYFIGGDIEAPTCAEAWPITTRP